MNLPGSMHNSNIDASQVQRMLRVGFKVGVVGIFLGLFEMSS